MTENTRQKAIEAVKIDNLTVIVPVYNRASLVLRAIESIVNQDPAPGHLVMVDNGSTDDTVRVLQNWHKTYRGATKLSLLSEARRGACAARNKGLTAVSTPWVMFFDSDDEMLPGHMARVARAISADDCDIAGWDSELRGRDGSRRILPFYDRRCVEHNILHGMMSTQRWVARTALVQRAGGWRQDIPIWNDIELGARMLALNPRVRHMAGAPTVAVNAGGDDSITGSGFASRAGRYEAALDAIRAVVGPKATWAVDLKAGILAADIGRENPSIKTTLPPGAWARTGYVLRRLGLRGTGRIIMLLKRPVKP